MSNDSDRKTALVTGGAKRVGRAIVERLSDAGFDVAFTYLGSEAEAVDLAKMLVAKGRRAVAIRADLAHPPAAAEAISSGLEDFSTKLDVLVNSASLYEPATLAQTTPELTHKLMAVNFESPLFLCQKFADRLRAARGHIVNMVDLLAEKPWPQYMAYCASKAALVNFTLSLSRELAPQVTVNGIAPGVVDWPEDFPAAAREQYLKRVPLARAGTPEDVANLVHFLVSDGSYITGQILHLDGGRSIT